jgi:hypothetical protein
MPGKESTRWKGSFRLGIAGLMRAPIRACPEAGLLVTQPVGIQTGRNRDLSNRDSAGAGKYPGTQAHP